jgi:hypothetical protein
VWVWVYGCLGVRMYARACSFTYPACNAEVSYFARIESHPRLVFYFRRQVSLLQSEQATVVASLKSIPCYQWLSLFGTKRDEITGDWRRLHTKELYALY